MPVRVERRAPHLHRWDPKSEIEGPVATVATTARASAS
jgi:hypothetical protein